MRIEIFNAKSRRGQVAKGIRSFSLRLCGLCVFALMIFGVAANAQTVDEPCPADKVCITRDAALKALADADLVAAQTAELKAKDAAIADLKTELGRMRIEFAEKSGENTALKQNAVSDRAIIDLLLKSVRKKCMPFSVCF